MNGLATILAGTFIGTVFGFLWGHYHGSKEVYRMEWDTKNRVARYEAALKDIANWDNYNSGGDVAFGGTHPGVKAERVLDGKRHDHDEG